MLVDNGVEYVRLSDLLIPKAFSLSALRSHLGFQIVSLNFLTVKSKSLEQIGPILVVKHICNISFLKNARKIPIAISFIGLGIEYKFRSPMACKKLSM